MRPLDVRRSTLLLCAMLLGLAVWPAPQPPAEGACAAPYLEVAPGEAVARGETITVKGRAFTGGGCQDNMSCPAVPGCGACEYEDPPPTPLRDVDLRLRQDGQTWELDVADSGTPEDGELGHVTWRFVVPTGAEPGRARLVTDHSQPVRVRIR